MADSQADDRAILEARIRGRQAGDDDKPASANPYPPDTHAAQHDAWEEGRQDGIRDL